MKVETETIVDDGTEGLVWAVSPEGNPVFVAWVGDRRVRVELTPAQVKEVACGGIYAAMTVELAQSPTNARTAMPTASRIVSSGNA